MIATVSRIQSHRPIRPTQADEMDDAIVSVNLNLGEDGDRAHASLGGRNDSHSSSENLQDNSELHLFKGGAISRNVVKEADCSMMHKASLKANRGERGITRSSDNKHSSPQQQPLQQPGPSKQDSKTGTLNESVVFPKSNESRLTSEESNSVATEESGAETEAETMNSSLTICASTDNEAFTSTVPFAPGAKMQYIPDTQDTLVTIEKVVSGPASPTSCNDGGNNSQITNTDSSASVQVSPSNECEDEELVARKQRQVCFSRITIRRYPMTLGDVSVAFFFPRV